MQTSDPSIEQHSPAQSLLFHLLPGFLIGAAYFALIPVLRQIGYPSITALMITVILVLTPVELGYLLYQGKRKNGFLSLRGIVMYRESIPAWQYFVWVPGLFLLLGLIFTLLKPLDVFLQQTLFPWVPVLESGLQADYSKDALIVTYILAAVFGVLVGPTVEELYFRGFLLPRMRFAGKWAPLLHSFLFAIYHIWTPWMFITRTLGMLPLVYAVQRRNLYVSILVHFLVNLLDVVAGINFIVAMTG